MSGNAPDIDTMAAQLDEWHGSTWDTYRKAAGGWNVRCGEQSYHGDTLTAAIVAAYNDGPPLPRIPKRPVEYGRIVGVHKDRYWRLRVQTTEVRWLTFGAYDTKREATAALAGVLARNAEMVAEWDERYAATVAAGGEGVTWRWET